jgi:NADP-dependent aldehyde dehydrogenase
MSNPIVHPVLIDGAWRPSEMSGTFSAVNPQTGVPLAETYPVSTWPDLEAALVCADRTALELRALPDADARTATFLDRYASHIEANAEALASIASEETALPTTPRLRNVEIPRTINQLRLAASAVREGSWRQPTIDSKINLRSCLAPIGPVWVIGPNNFPFAYNAISGGDFASAIAAGNPVIAKSHPLHPTTTRRLAELAHAALIETAMPPGAVQLLYHMSPDDGLNLIAEPRLASIGFTGSRSGGLKLKSAADAAGKPFFGEMSSVNPVVYLPGAIAERPDEIISQFVTSCLMATGQFCTNPGFNLLVDSPASRQVIDQIAAKFASEPSGTLLSASGTAALLESISALRAAGATLVAGGAPHGSNRFSVNNALLTVSGKQFLRAPDAFQREMFGNAALFVIAETPSLLREVIAKLEGNLTGTIYSSTTGADDALYATLAPLLRRKVGRLLNDKMPTGVAVSPAMNHGGPYPATSQPHFTAVGFPASLYRFTQLESYDNVRHTRLPPSLQNPNPTGKTWRLINGTLTTADVPQDTP